VVVVVVVVSYIFIILITVAYVYSSPILKSNILFIMPSEANA